jgi:hypothetical protein
MSAERRISVLSGWVPLPVAIVLPVVCVVAFIWTLVQAERSHQTPNIPLLVAAIAGFLGWILMLPGFFVVLPNQAKVLILFGDYRGTVRDQGFHWANPFYTKMPMSLRLRNQEGEKLKVNDKQGNPIEIAAVVVWRVAETAQAAFDVEDYVQYVRIQTETAVRHLANSFAYDHGEEQEITLRSGVEEVSQALKNELHQRLAKAGIEVEDARITHLAYAPEIASAMLRRQQADAVIAARQKIVHGAVSMVEMALSELADRKVVQLDDERKAAMVSNLLVVLCGETEVHPVVNAGTLYN